MKLYTYPPAPSPRRVHLFLAEKQVELPQEVIDLRAGEHFAEAYRAINPLCTVPALVLDDGTVLTQLPAIHEFLEAQFPDPPMLGRDARERGVVREWSHRVYVEGLMAVAEILRNDNPAYAHRALPGPLDLEQIPALAERGRRRLAEFYSVLDRRLGESEFLAGSAYSVADSDALVVCDFARVVRMRPAEELDHLQRWLKAVNGRRSVQACRIEA
ncbi:MAG: glutathione S-transferase [Xanthomonadales bacterium]|nr:glutathione S-transferase [Xanthomonadales bacterium]